MVFESYLESLEESVDNYFEKIMLKNSDEAVENGDMEFENILEGARYLSEFSSDSDVSAFGECLHEYTLQVEDAALAANNAETQKSMLESGEHDALSGQAYEDATGEAIDEIKQARASISDTLDQMVDTRDRLTDLYNSTEDVEGFDHGAWGHAIFALDDIRQDTFESTVDIYRDIEQTYAEV